jgi:integrase
MPTEYRKNRKKWGYRFFLHGKSWKRYAWDTQEDAKNAEAEQRAHLLKNPPLKVDSLGNIAALYLIDSAEQGRSKWRIDALRLNFNAHILPFFKAETPIASIKKSRIEDFIKHHKRRNVKNSTIWHYIKDLRALFYWAMENPDEDRPFLRANPVSGANLDPIQNRKVVKPPLKIKDFERAFSVLDQYERAWWRTHDSLGLRMDEGNRLQKTDVDFDSGLIRIPGTKTAESDCYLPMSPQLQVELKSYLASRSDDSPYLFPGRSAQTKGKKIYSRRRLFEKIRRVTAFNAYMEKNPSSTTMQAWKELKRQSYPGGVKLTTKELRDYFATQVSAQVTDPNTVMKLLRHTSLNTTSRYTRTVMERMKDAVQNLGRPLEASLGGNSGGKLERKSAQTALLLKLLKTLDRAPAAKEGAESIKGNLAKTKRKSGGRSRT